MKYFIALLILIYSTELKSASFKVRNIGDATLQITLSGKIRFSDEKKFRKVLLDSGVLGSGKLGSRADKYPIVLRLNSEGGELIPLF